jgi:hypothetical protein
MGLTGLEPVTLRLSSACSNQLSYRPVAFAAQIFDFDCRFSTAFRDISFVCGQLLKIGNRNSQIENQLEARGFEPLTSSLQSWRSTN